MGRADPTSLTRQRGCRESKSDLPGKCKGAPTSIKCAVTVERKQVSSPKRMLKKSPRFISKMIRAKTAEDKTE